MKARRICQSTVEVDAEPACCLHGKVVFQESPSSADEQFEAGSLFVGQGGRHWSLTCLPSLSFAAIASRMR